MSGRSGQSGTSSTGVSGAKPPSGTGCVSATNSSVSTGRATAADRNRLHRNDYGRTGGGTHDRWARAGAGSRNHPVPDGYAERFQLPQRMVCGPCGAENLIDDADVARRGLATSSAGRARKWQHSWASLASAPRLCYPDD